MTCTTIQSFGLVRQTNIFIIFTCQGCSEFTLYTLSFYCSSANYSLCRVLFLFTFYCSSTNHALCHVFFLFTFKSKSRLAVFIHPMILTAYMYALFWIMQKNFKRQIVNNSCTEDVLQSCMIIGTKALLGICTLLLYHRRRP